MDFRPLSGFVPRLDTNGNLGIFDPTGAEVIKWISGSASITGNKSTNLNNVPISSTTSTTGVYEGHSAQITPQVSTAVFVFGYMQQVSNGTAGDGSAFSIRQHTGASNPAGGAAVTDSVLVSAANLQDVANDYKFVNIATLATGLTLGQIYSFLTAATVITAGTMSWTGAFVQAIEL